MNIDMNYVVDLMKEILSIPSPGGDTYDGIERMKKEFESLDIPFKMTNKGALIGTIKGEDDDKQVLVSAHIDTLGAMVKDIKPNGRLKLSNIGGVAWGSVEGENVIVKTIEGKSYTGTILPEKASVHIFSDEARECPRDEETIEVRLDEDVCSREDTEKLGIAIGDFVSFDPRTIITKSGYIKSRHLDDKACVAALLGAYKYIKDNNLKLKHTTHLFISNYEEMGHGVSAIPEKTKEFLALDIGTVGGCHTSDEHCVTIVAKDSRTPYDFLFRKKLVDLAKANDINYKVDVHFRYGSDASLSVMQGVDVNFACIGMGVDATHHYERTHIDGVCNNAKLIVAYLTK